MLFGEKAANDTQKRLRIKQARRHGRASICDLEVLEPFDFWEETEETEDCWDDDWTDFNNPDEGDYDEPDFYDFEDWGYDDYDYALDF